MLIIYLSANLISSPRMLNGWLIPGWRSASSVLPLSSNPLKPFCLLVFMVLSYPTAFPGVGCMRFLYTLLNFLCPIWTGKPLDKFECWRWKSKTFQHLFLAEQGDRTKYRAPAWARALWRGRELSAQCWEPGTIPAGLWRRSLVESFNALGW